MMMLWISCLLIGSITCSPVPKDQRSEAAGPAATGSVWRPFASPYWSSGPGVSSDPGSFSSQPSLPSSSSDKATGLPASQDAVSSAGSYSYNSNPNVAEPEAFSGYGYGYNSPGVSDYWVAYAASQPSGYDGNSAPGGNYGSSDNAYGGESSYGSVVAPGDENWSAGSAGGYGDENPEPVFSDVSDLEPVYSFSSRSSYQRGKSVFAQTRYTPGEPAPPLMPVPRYVSKTTSKQRSPAKAPPKGF